MSMSRRQSLALADELKSVKGKLMKEALGDRRYNEDIQPVVEKFQDSVPRALRKVQCEC